MWKGKCWAFHYRIHTFQYLGSFFSGANWFPKNPPVHCWGCNRAGCWPLGQGRGATWRSQSEFRSHFQSPRSVSNIIPLLVPQACFQHHFSSVSPEKRALIWYWGGGTGDAQISGTQRRPWKSNCPSSQSAYVSGWSWSLPSTVTYAFHFWATQQLHRQITSCIHCRSLRMKHLSPCVNDHHSTCFRALLHQVSPAILCLWRFNFYSFTVFWVGFFFFLLFWPCQTARGILVPQPGIEPKPSALETHNLNHWTTREVPEWDFCKGHF